MNKIIAILALLAVLTPAAFAHVLPSQVNSNRSFTAALDTNQIIQNYLSGGAEPTPEVFLEMLKFCDEVKPTDITDRVSWLLEEAERVGKQLPELDAVTRERLQPIMNSLFSKFNSRLKSKVMWRLFDQLWFWTPDHLEFMGRMIRNDKAYLISTQLIWVLERSTEEQRRAFFMQLLGAKINNLTAWFAHALEYKYGVRKDVQMLKRALKFVNPGNLRPPPIPVVLNGIALGTSADLYAEMVIQFPDIAPKWECWERLTPEMLEIYRAQLNQPKG